MKKLTPLLLLTIYLSASLVNAEPTTADYALGYTGLGVSLAGELLFRDVLAPKAPRMTEPGPFDAYCRNALKWRDDRLAVASFSSDVLLFLGAFPSALWTPLLSDNDYASHLLLNVQVMAVNGLLMHAAKFTVGRQRPAARFGTWDSLGSHDNLSFYSGHASYSFAIAVSSAYILSKNHPDSKLIVWAIAMTIAATTSYLRVAADLHYMSDILAGAAVGASVGYLVPRLQFDRFFDEPEHKPKDFQVSFQFAF